MRTMSQFRTWEFDMFEVRDVCGDAFTLPYLALTIFYQLGIESELDIPMNTFADYMLSLSRTYHPTDVVLYHNSLHAADVIFTHYFFTKSPIYSDCSLLDLFASLIACAAHDVDHNGFNNTFHKNSESELAILYNDISVLENHHAASGWKILKEHNFLCNLSKEDRKRFRDVYTSCILHTDMAKHGQYLVEVKNVVRSKECNATGDCDVTYDNLLAYCVHTADLSNPAKYYSSTQQWVSMLMEEFFRQGDKEKKMGLPISLLCDRFRTNVSVQEAVFIKCVVKPWYTNIAAILGDTCDEPLRQLDINFQIYTKQGDLIVQREAKHIKRKSMFHDSRYASKLIDSIN
eukprot:UN34201